MKRKTNRSFLILLCMLVLLSLVPAAVLADGAEAAANADASRLITAKEAQEIALKDAGLDEVALKIVFTETELILNQGRPCYVLDFYTGESRYYYQIDAKSGEIIFRSKYILPAEAMRIAVEDAGCTDRVLFIEETLVGGGIKSPYYRLVFADTKTQWTYRIDAVLGNIMGKEKEDIGTAIFIPLRQAQEIALKDAGLDEVAQKIVFTETELIRNQGRPCYVLDFYTGESRYYYQIDAKTCEIIFRNKYILPAEARRIAVEDAGCTERVLFTEETLVDGGIKSPYYLLVFADAKTQWTYRIDAVSGGILEKQKKDIGTTGQEWKSPFDDVRESDWFYRSVKFAYAGGLMRGVSDTEFSPDTDVTRAMFVMILYRIEKEPQAGSTSFADVEIGDYYEKAVAWANANGIVSGVSEKRFAPNEPITREQMATIIYRYAAFKGYDIRTSGKIAYTDSSDISDYAKDAVSWAAEEALMAGHADGRFLPRENATRAQTAAVFMRMLGDSK